MALFDDVSRLLPNGPVLDLDDYVEAGGGAGLAALLELDREEVIARVADSGLRGRGGAGFRTGAKWRSIIGTASDHDLAVSVVVNAAEGEPGTYKDRALMRWNPFQVLEGVLIARYAVQSPRVFIGLKDRATEALPAMATALAAAREAGWPGADVVELVRGPDEYLFGEETALLEVIEGDLPMPRHVAPYMNGLFTETSNPSLALVNNVETLANVPAIVARGPEWFRGQGTDESPGTMVFTLTGDVENAGCWELPLGTPLSTLVSDIGGAVDPMMVVSGVSAAIITPDLLDTPMSFDAMAAAGLGLGSGGFVVYDHSHCVVRVAATLSRFLSVESCGQCNACQLGTSAITAILDRIEAGDGEAGDLQELATRAMKVTDLQRCALPTGEQLLTVSLLESFHDELTDHLGRPCHSTRERIVPKLTHLDLDTGEFTYDPDYHRKREDWSYAPA